MPPTSLPLRSKASRTVLLATAPAIAATAGSVTPEALTTREDKAQPGRARYVHSLSVRGRQNHGSRKCQRTWCRIQTSKIVSLRSIESPLRRAPIILRSTWKHHGRLNTPTSEKTDPGRRLRSDENRPTPSTLLAVVGAAYSVKHEQIPTTQHPLTVNTGSTIASFFAKLFGVYEKVYRNYILSAASRWCVNAAYRTSRQTITQCFFFWLV